MRVFIVFCALSVANGFGGGAPPPSPHHHHHHHGGHQNKHPHPHKLTPRQIPHFYNSLPPHIIASPRPMNPTFRTLNPASTHPNQHHQPHPSYHEHQPHRSPRSEPKQPNLLTSASTTPVLVLKKDHTRPILSSAVLASTIQEKRQQTQHANNDQKPIPTVIMERPGSNQNHQQHTKPQPPQQKQEPTEPPQEEPKPQQPPQQPSSHETSLEQDNQSNELPPQPQPPTASAERRMFFGSISQNGALSHQVSGPQGPSNPHTQHHRQKPQPQQRLSHSASNVQQTRAHAQPQKPHNPPHFGEDSQEDENLERITRSNSQNPYQGGSQFEYPPPQGNYIASGPTRVPVKYQQGVIGVRPQHQQGQGERAGPYQDGRPRPYKQRIQQGQQSEEPLSEELEDEEEAKPDRLQELLATSKFTCGGKKDGYYADDTLNCEVFHYCQDGGKHSWLCPNGFAFHQIHLICVPPSSDNICKQSADFHFVNEYLYRPVNQKEADSSHNISLKYADRYFPDEYNNGAGDVLLPYNNQESEEDDRPVRTQQQRPHPQQVAHNPYATPQQQQSHRPRPQPTQQTPPYNPYAQAPRPSQYPSFIPSPQVPQQRPQQQSHRPSPHNYSQRSGPPPTPHHHAAAQKQVHVKPHPTHTHPNHPNHPSQKHQTAFFSPESINIPLNQRRPIPNPHPSHHPQIFRPSPQVHSSKPAQAAKDSSSRRKFEDEDEYEY